MPRPTAAFPCCRAHDLFAPVEDYARSILRAPGDEAYWFDWRSSFHGNATIHIARLGSEAVVFRLYRPSKYGKGGRFRGFLTPNEWARLENAVVAANFWMLDECGGQHGLDGAIWSFAGRRGHDFHYIRRWSPDDALWDLGRLFFDVAGLEEVRLY